MTAGKRYVTDVRVRWSDLDAFGHVNNARTVTLLEEARVAWLFVEAARHGAGRLTEGVVVATLDIAYRRQIGFGLPVSVSMGLTAQAASCAFVFATSSTSASVSAASAASSSAEAVRVRTTASSCSTSGSPGSK